MKVEASKDKSLARRAQSLQRFLLEHLNREMAQRRLTVSPPLPDSSSHVSQAADLCSTDEPSTVIDRVFGMLTRQRIKCKVGDAETTRDSNSFQVRMHILAVHCSLRQLALVLHVRVRRSNVGLMASFPV